MVKNGDSALNGVPVETNSVDQTEQSADKSSKLKRAAKYVVVGGKVLMLTLSGCSGNTLPPSDPPAAIDEDPNYEEGTSGLNGLSIGDGYIVVDIDPADAANSAANNGHTADGNQSQNDQSQGNSTPMDALEWERAEGAEPERLHQELIQRFTAQGWTEDDFRLSSVIFNESTGELSVAIETYIINSEFVNARFRYDLIGGNFVLRSSFIDHRTEGNSRLVDEIPPRPR